MQRLLYQSFNLPIIRVGCDLGLFGYLVESEQPVSTAALAEKTGASPLLLSRILRYLASVDVIRETGSGIYTSSSTTRTLAVPGWQGAVYHCFDVIGPCVNAFPDFLQEQGYQNAGESGHCAFNKDHNVEGQVFEWLGKRPERSAHFDSFMSVQHEGMPTWLDKYPFLEIAAKRPSSATQPLFVDVGGGIGHQSVALRRALPDRIQGRIIVQDQSVMLTEQAPRHPGVEHMANDFFTGQPIRGACMYYLRNVMHDWPDGEATVILARLEEAMAGDSVLLIDYMVLPASGTHWHAAQVDMVVMASMAARERTLQEWEALVPRAGLRIRRVYQYTDSLRDSIIECVRA